MALEVGQLIEDEKLINEILANKKNLCLMTLKKTIIKNHTFPISNENS